MAVTQKQCVPAKKKAKGWDAQKDSLCQIYFKVRRARPRIGIQNAFWTQRMSYYYYYYSYFLRDLNTSSPHPFTLVFALAN